LLHRGHDVRQWRRLLNNRRSGELALALIVGRVQHEGDTLRLKTLAQIKALALKHCGSKLGKIGGRPSPGKGSPRSRSRWRTIGSSTGSPSRASAWRVLQMLCKLQERQPSPRKAAAGRLGPLACGLEAPNFPQICARSEKQRAPLGRPVGFSSLLESQLPSVISRN
jgi:hypothetical protein